MSMDRLFDSIKQLPTIPQLLHQLIQSFANPNVSLQQVAKLIAMDQVLCAKVLRVANSATYGSVNTVTSIEQATIRLGLNRLRSMVLASGIIGSFKANSHFDRRSFWINTFEVANIAKLLAEQSDACEPDTAFTCAMLHNIGELLIQTYQPEQAAQIQRLSNQGVAQSEAQRQILGYHYAQVGAQLAQRWGFSPTVVNAIGQQLNPLACSPVNTPAVLIRLALFIALAWRAGVPTDTILARFPCALAKHLILIPSSLAGPLETLHSQENYLAELLVE